MINERLIIYIYITMRVCEKKFWIKELLVGYSCLDIFDVRDITTCVLPCVNERTRKRGGHHIRKRRWFWVKLQYLKRLWKASKAQKRSIHLLIVV